MPRPANPESADEKTKTPARSRPPVVLPNPAEPWKHPDELEYIRPYAWTNVYLISYLLDNVFDVPPRHPPGSIDPWCVVVCGDGTPIMIPKGYRLPLMFAMKFQWESLRLVLSSPQREEEWENYQYDILHVGRLCTMFLQKAREAMANDTMDKSWRSPMFDRALTRYYRRWLVNREEFVMAFWKEFEEAEYEQDVLKKDWTRFVLKGHKGFHLTKEECAEGLSHDTLTAGLKFCSDDYTEFYRWDPVLPPAPPPASLEPESAKGKRSRKTTGKRKRSGDKEKDTVEEEGGKDKDNKAAKDQDKDRDKVGTKSSLRAQASPTRKPKGPIVNPGETESAPPPKKARVEEVKEKETVQAPSNLSVSGTGESLQLSQVSSRAVVDGQEVEGAKEVEKEEAKGGGDQPDRLSIVEGEGVKKDGKDKEKEKEVGEDPGRFMENESITSLPVDEGVDIQRPRTSDDEDKGKMDMAGKCEEKEKGGNDEDEDEDALVAEGLMYPQSSSAPMWDVSQVFSESDNYTDNYTDEFLRDAYDPDVFTLATDSVPAHDNEKNANENEKDEDVEKNNGGASAAELPDPAVVTIAVDSVLDPAPAPALSPAATSAVTAPIDSVSISNDVPNSTAASDPMTSTDASTSTSSVDATTNAHTHKNTNTNTNTKHTSKPATRPPSPTFPSHTSPFRPNLELLVVLQRLDRQTNGWLSGWLDGIYPNDASASGSASGCIEIDEDQGPFHPPSSPTPSTSASAPAVVDEGSSEHVASQDETGSERATTIKVSGPEIGTAAGVGGGAPVPPSAVGYFPQIPQCDTEEMERALQSANAAGTTSAVGSPVTPAATRFLSPALTSGPSNSNSASGAGSGSGVLSVSANPSPKLSPAPSVVEAAPTPVPVPVSPPQPPVPAQSSPPTIAVSLAAVAETVPDYREAESLGEQNSATTAGPMDVDPAPCVESFTPASYPAPLISEVDAPSETPAPLSPVQALDLQRLSRSLPRSVSSAPSPSADRKKSRAAKIPSPISRPRAREPPPLPGPSLPGPSPTFEEYQLAAAAWSGSGSSDHGNDVNSREHEGMREHVSEHQHEHERDLRHNRADHRYERATYYDGYHRHSATPGLTPYRRYHPYPYPPPSQPQYYSFAPPCYPPAPYNDYPPYLPPSVSAPYRPSRSSVNGSLSAMQSPVPPDVDSEDVEVDGSPVATRIVSIVQDMMAKLTDAMSVSGSVGDYGVGGERRRQSSVPGSVSADASVLRCNYPQSERARRGESLKLEDVLGEIQLLKEDHQREVSKMRNEIEGLRMKVQDLEERSTREQGTAEAMEIVGSDSEVTVANGVAVESSSSYPIDLTAEARDKSFPVNRFVSLVAEDILHRLGTPFTTNIGEDNSSLVLRQEEGVGVSEVDKGKEKEKESCPPRIGPTSSNDGIQMSPSHNGLPLPIKSQRKGRMFVPIDMTDDNQ